MAEKTKVKLRHKDNEQEFDVQHAERLLNLQVKRKLSDWELSPNQPFEFKDGAITPKSQGANKGTKE